MLMNGDASRTTSTDFVIPSSERGFDDSVKFCRLPKNWNDYARPY